MFYLFPQKLDLNQRGLAESSFATSAEKFLLPAIPKDADYR